MRKHVPFTIIPIAILLVIAALILAIGGWIAGWDIVGILTSPTAILFYAILLVAVSLVAFKYFSDRDLR